MSDLTANTVFPLVSALSDTEKRVLLKKLQDSFKESEIRETGWDNIPPKFRPENKETLIHELIHGKSS